MQIEKSEDLSNAPSFLEAFRFWFILGWISFGGTTGHISIMHAFLVEKKKWISNSKFYHALNACMLLPGPEAHQLAIYIGWKLHGIKGGIISGICFILPAILILLGLSITYAIYGNTELLTNIFNAVKPAVLAIIVFATIQVSKKAFLSPFYLVIALSTFILSYFAHVSMPILLILVILLGILIYFVAPQMLKAKGDHIEVQDLESHEKQYYMNALQAYPKISVLKIAKQIFVFILLWIIPFLLISYFLKDPAFWQQESLLFTQSAFLTIGGSYTVIPYVAGIVTSKLMWLTKAQMIDGFALAETTPGPLVIVLSYIGFMAAFNHFEGSIIMGVMGLLVASYFTFLPNFLLIFVAGPMIERSQKNKLIQAVLSLVTAAVVGVIANLACYLAEGILFKNQQFSFEAFDWIAVLWFAISMLLLARFKINMLVLVLLSIVFGVLQYFLSY